MNPSAVLSLIGELYEITVISKEKIKELEERIEQLEQERDSGNDTDHLSDNT